MGYVDLKQRTLFYLGNVSPYYSAVAAHWVKESVDWLSRQGLYLCSFYFAVLGGLPPFSPFPPFPIPPLKKDTMKRSAMDTAHRFLNNGVFNGIVNKW